MNQTVYNTILWTKNCAYDKKQTYVVKFMIKRCNELVNFFVHFSVIEFWSECNLASPESLKFYQKISSWSRSKTHSLSSIINGKKSSS